MKGALIVIGEASAGPGFAREVRISLVVLSLVFAVELVVTVLTLIRLVGLVGSSEKDEKDIEGCELRYLT